MRKKIAIFFGLLFFLLLIIFFWWNQAIKPFNPLDNKAVNFRIEKGEYIKEIAERLHKQNLIRSPVSFFLYTRFSKIANKIQAGEFQLKPSMDLFTITKTLTHGTMDAKITIPEGLRIEEIATKLTQEFGTPESEFLKHAREGYMFPDTYFIPKDATVSAIVNIFLTNFNKKVTEKEIQLAKEKGLTLHELITIASMVEREAKYPEDRPLVASVILNRLKSQMKLDIDATVQYALGYQPKEKTWWKKELTLDDLNIESPYNTYKNPGLPPNPICNPGKAVIEAVINAPKTDYYYYISDNSGKIHFAKNFEEHQKNIAKYLSK